MWNWILQQLSEIGHSALEFIGVVLVCAVAYPITRIGSHARAAVTLHSNNYTGTRLARSARYAVLGAIFLIVTTIILKYTVPGLWWLGFASLSTILVGLGCFGLALVPEEFADE